MRGGWAAFALERFKNIRQTQRIDEKLHEIQDDLRESGLLHSRLSMVDWRLADYEPPGKPILFTRIRGSPAGLEQDSILLSTYSQVRTDVEAFNIDDDVKTAISVVAVEQILPESRFDDILQKLPESRRQKIERSRHKISRSAKELSLPTVLSLVRKASPDLPVTVGTDTFLSALDDYAMIAEKAVQRPEFLQVLRSWGQLDISTLESMYSKLMALVLRDPGKNAVEYHQMRLGITEIERAHAATREELTSLVDLGYLKFDSKKRYWPNYSFIKKQYGISAPKIATLSDWLGDKIARKS